jgi:hypothetical protein
MDYQQNFLNALQGGFQFGQQIKQQRDQTALNRLTGQAYTAPREQRADHLAQVATISPQAAQAQQRAWAADDEADQKQLIGMARFIKAAPPEQQQAAYQNAILPRLRARGMDAPDWTPETQGTILKTVDALTQWDGGGGGEEQFTLSPGSKRFDPVGNVVAEVPFAPMRPQIYTDGEGGVHWLTPPSDGGVGAPAPQPSVPISGGLDFSGDLEQFAASGIPVSSTRRTPQRNQEVGGVANSYHLTGEAADITHRNPQEKQQATQYWRGKGYQVIDEGDHLHIEPPRRGMTTSQVGGTNTRGAGGSAPGMSTQIPGLRGPTKQNTATTFLQLTPDEVQRAGLPAGTVAQRNQATGAIDVVSKPDSRTGSGGVIPLSAGEAASVRKQFKETKDAFNMFKAFDAALAEVPNDPRLLTDGAAKGRLGTAYNNARASLRVLYNTGVLQPGELPMLENALRDPTSFGAIMDPRTRSQIDAQLGELYRVIEKNIDTQVESYPQLFNLEVYRSVKQGQQQQSAARYKVGQIISEGGRRYRVVGGDLERNPEVEEVR